MHAFGNAGAALLYSALFLPDLIEVEGYVFLKDLGVLPSGGWPEVAADIAKRRDTSSEAVTQYMSSCNWIEVPYLFADQSGSSDEIDALAKTIQQAWNAHLLKQYPQKTFEVRVLTPAETGSVVGVGFVEVAAAEKAATPRSS